MTSPSSSKSSGQPPIEPTTSDWLYPYPELLSGRLLKRYKRFMADIELDSGETITAHCPNTGPMTGVSKVGSAVKVSRSNNPKRKLAYTWELIQVPSEASPSAVVWTGINTALPNRVMRSALENHLFSALGPYDTIRPEVRYAVITRAASIFCLRGHQMSDPFTWR